MRAVAAAFACACACAAPATPARPPLQSGAVPPDPAPALTEACVRRFVAAQPLAAPVSAPDVWRVPKHGAGPHYYLFDVEYGAPAGCGGACNPSYAHGVALSCDRIGWYSIIDDTDGAARPTRFALRPTDALLFDASLWKDAVAPDFFFWLARDPAAPAAVREQALRDQPEVYY